MTGAPPALRTLAFGELEPGAVWGAAWFEAPDGPAVTALGADGGEATLASLGLTAFGDGEEWRLDGDGAELLIAPAGEVVAAHSPEDGIEGCDQLCRVSGRFVRDGADRSVDCLGLRTWWPGTIDLGRFESIRAVSVWFEPDEGLALTAFRPRKARAHHASDVLAAAVITADGAPAVEDPRLSTTYDEQGWPLRVGLELWLAGEEPEHQYPRRASGEAMGARAEALAGAVEVRAEPLRWHSRGRDGAGMYVLARRR
jgi:hypothetical protein